MPPKRRAFGKRNVNHTPEGATPYTFLKALTPRLVLSPSANVQHNNPLQEHQSSS